jgi:hypothetical protein
VKKEKTMSYDDKRSYLSIVVPAQNIIATASGATLLTSTLNAAVIPISEPTTIVSMAVVTTASSSNQVGALKYLLLQTNTTSIGLTGTNAGTLNAVSTFTLNPGVAVPAGTWLNVLAVGTGTASATETASAVNVTIGCAPQYV